MTDYTKSTHAIDARGNKVRVEFFHADIDGHLCFAMLDAYYNGADVDNPGSFKYFKPDGKHFQGQDITLCPPEPEEPPVWALKMACELSEFDYESLNLGGLFGKTIRAHAITLAKHEEERVDPDLVKAREYAGQAWEASDCLVQGESCRNGHQDGHITVQAALLAIKGERT